VSADICADGQKLGDIGERQVPFSTHKKEFFVLLSPVSGKDTYFARNYYFDFESSLRCKSPEVCITDCKDASYAVRFSPLPYLPPVHPEVRGQISYGTPQLRHTATLLYDNSPLVIAECREFMHQLRLPAGAQNTKLEPRTLSGKEVAEVSAEIDGRRYFAVIDFDDDYFELFAGYAEELELSGDTLTVTRRFTDHAGHITVTQYRKGGRTLYVKEIQRYVSKQREGEPLPQLLPYLFFESLHAGFLDEAQSYLSPGFELSEQAAKEFFGEFAEVVQHPFDASPALLYIAAPGQQYLRRFGFETEDGKISNITEL